MSNHRNWYGRISLWLCFVLPAVVVSGTVGRGLPDPQLPQAKKTVITPEVAQVCAMTDGFTLAAVGDVIYSEPLAALNDAPFQAALAILRGADATFGNLENTLIDLSVFSGHPQAESGGAHLIGSPKLAKDMREMGFNLVSRANNHTTDWGAEGMRETDQTADAAGLVHAGTGDSRAAARAAHYLLTAKGRVGLVAMSSTPTGFPFLGPPMAVASDPLGRVPGRPGLSALRLTPSLIVSPEMMRSLRQIHDALPAAERQAEAQERQALRPEGTSDPGTEPDEISLLGTKYRVGDNPVRYSYAMNDRDLREILKGIRQGKQNSNFLVATIHAHEPMNWSEEPADFLPKLAHAAIDAGADAFIGHGPHRLRAIEIYKGKPIFYSLGNFFFQMLLQEPAPADVYEMLGRDPETTTDNELEARTLKRWFEAPVWYQSVIAVSRFDHGQVAEIRLYPVDLGLTAGNVEQGIPRLAGPELGRKILEELQRLSRPFGTSIAIEEGVGIIRGR